MSINTGNKELDALLAFQLKKLASTDVPQGNLLSNIARIREAAFHDFSTYHFLITPDYTRKISPFPGAGLKVDGTSVGLGTYNAFDKFVSLFKPIISDNIRNWFLQEGSKMDDLGGYDSSHPGLEVSDSEAKVAVQANAMDGFCAGMAGDLYKIYTATSQKDLFLTSAFTACMPSVVKMVGMEETRSLPSTTPHSGKRAWQT